MNFRRLNMADPNAEVLVRLIPESGKRPQAGVVVEVHKYKYLATNKLAIITLFTLFVCVILCKFQVTTVSSDSKRLTTNYPIPGRTFNFVSRKHQEQAKSSGQGVFDSSEIFGNQSLTPSSARNGAEGSDEQRHEVDIPLIMALEKFCRHHPEGCNSGKLQDKFGSIFTHHSKD